MKEVYIQPSNCLIVFMHKKEKKNSSKLMQFAATEVLFSLPLLIYQTFKGFLVAVKDGALSSYK